MSFNQASSSTNVDSNKQQDQPRWNTSQAEGFTQAGQGSSFFGGFSYPQSWTQPSRYFDTSNVDVEITASDWSFRFKGPHAAHHSIINALPAMSSCLSKKAHITDDNKCEST